MAIVRWVIALAVVQALAVAGYLWIERGRTGDAEAPLRAERVSGAAPPLDLRRADGTALTLADLHGRFVLLHFWASWCAPCRVELPELLDLGRALSDDGHRLSVVAAAVDDDWQAIGAFFDGEVPAEVVRVGDDARRSYDVSTLPDTYLIGPDGTLLVRLGGAREWRRPAAQAQLGEWLGPPAAR